MRATPGLLLLMLLAPTTVAQESEPGASAEGDAPAFVAPDLPGKDLFLRACATCHGVDGSGQGPTVLDRPARNFKDGGFSFGNTTDALVRSIGGGIPGTPMPGFAATFAPEDIRLLAEYVAALGPPANDDPGDNVVVVGAEAVVLRGLLDSAVEGAPRWPRGLLLGLPGGLSLEYRADDVRLVAARQGAFAERTDWGGRGGTSLRALGGLLHAFGGGDPATLFFVRDEDGSRAALTAQLSAWWTEGAAAGLEYELRTAGGRSVARVREEPRAAEGGVTRVFDVHATQPIVVRFAEEAGLRRKGASLGADDLSIVDGDIAISGRATFEVITTFVPEEPR